MRPQLLLTCGRCVVCGCTEDRACEYGCQWTTAARTHCSQCVCWAVLRRPNPYEGILPYDLLPVRNLFPLEIAGMRTGRGYVIDLRRIDEEARVKMAFVMAPRLGLTVDDVLTGYETGGYCAAAVPADRIDLVLPAHSVDAAAARAEQFGFGGHAGGCRRFDPAAPSTESTPRPRRADEQ